MRRKAPGGLPAVALCVALIAGACSSGDTAEDQDLWALMSFSNSSIEEYGSVAEMADAADLVIVGTVATVSVGREWGDPREPDGANVVASLVVKVAVTDVIAGVLPDAQTKAVTVEHAVAGYSADDLAKRISPSGVKGSEDSAGALPDGPAVWFLRIRGDLGSELSIAGDYDPIGGISYRLVAPQGLIAEKDGAAYTPLALANIDLDGSGHPNEVETLEERLAFEIAEATFTEIVARSR